MPYQNIDGAEECIARAKGYISSGNLEQAEKFLKKSVRLHPLNEAKTLLAHVEALRKKRENSSSADRSTSSQNGTRNPTAPRRRRVPESPPEQKEFSSEQKEIVDRINRTKDYYEILGVKKDFSENDLKKSYRKLAMKLHPDKNNAPGATEAFKRVSSAYQCLSEDSKRRIYDEHGTETPELRPQHTHYRQDELSPEDLFEMFFTGRAPRGRNRGRMFRRPHANQQQQRQQSPLAVLLQFLPLLVILFFSLFSLRGSDDKVYSMTRDNQFIHHRESANGIPFYVNGYYRWLDWRSQSQVERTVEKEFMQGLQDKCKKQKSRKSENVRKARNHKGTDLPEKLRRAENTRLPACDDLKKWYQKIRELGRVFCMAT
eukprot:210795_1